MVAIGDVLTGRYEIIERLGQGGMAAVYRAQDRQLGRVVAIKVLHPHFAEDPETVARFEREARAAAALSHPNIVDIYDVGSDDDTKFIVMAYVDGDDLAESLRLDGRRSPTEVASLGAQIADALDYAHRHGIIHRDVKPQNILIDSDRRARLTDFGIAEVVGSSVLTQSGWVMGTAFYMAPERAQGEPGGPASDIYSLGVVLFELLAGRRPFGGTSPVAIALQQMQQQPPSLGPLAPDAPPALVAAIERAMAYAPAERYSSARDLATDLRAAISREPAPTQGARLTTSEAPTRRVSMPSPPVSHGPVFRERSRRPLFLSAVRGFGAGLMTLLIIGGVIFGGSWLLGEHGASLLRRFAPAASPTRAPAAITPTRQPPTATSAVAARSPTAAVVTKPTAPPPTATVTPTPRPPTPTATQLVLVQVPDVVGRPQPQAEAALRGVGLAVTVRDGSDPGRPLGSVIGQAPPAGQRVEPGSVVTLTVNRPPASPRARVPNVEGMDEREARRTLEQAGFAVQVAETQVRPGQSKGTVVNQVPDAGATVDAGIQIRIEIGT